MSVRESNKARALANIVEAARSLLAERGLTETTTRAIAQAAGVSYQTLYNYFPSKGLLLRAVMADELASRTDALQQIVKQYRGNLLATLAEINLVSLPVDDDPNWALWREVAREAYARDEPEATLNPMGHERYHALLSMAQGVGELSSDVDLHLLAHTLACLTDYTLQRYYLLAEQDSNALRATLAEQLELVLMPYLMRAGGPA